MPNRFWERIRPWLLLVVLLCVSILFLLYGNAGVFRQARASALETTSWIEARFAWAGDFLTALEENNRLREENIELASQIARTREARLENDRLRRMLTYRDSTEAPLLPARVIAKDITRQQNLVTIDVGEADSVVVGMPVIDDRGIIGRVVLTSEHYARVMPLMNTDFRVPARVAPSKALGVVRWDGSEERRLLLEHVAKTETILPGQLVTTSESSSIFPDGLPVGYVDSVATRPGRSELFITLRPSVELGEVEYVFVILERPDAEIDSLRQRDIRSTAPAFGR